MKVLFLDVDGVLNSRNWFAKMCEPEFVHSTEDHLDPDAMRRINRVLDETGAKVVVSSTWRLIYDLENLEKMFRRVGFTGNLIGKTPTMYQWGNNPSRGDEIQEWLNQNKVDRYAIVDDDIDMLDSQQEFFVQTTFENGLTDERADKLIEILGKKQ